MATATPKAVVFKVGQKVSHAKYGTGKVESVRETAVGDFYECNFGDKINPNLKSCRKSTLTKA
jgi:hypothetical protein